jgi:hypothetical protein
MTDRVTTALSRNCPRAARAPGPGCDLTALPALENQPSVLEATGTGSLLIDPEEQRAPLWVAS